MACLLLALLVLDPYLLKGDQESSGPGRDPAAKTTLASIKIDTTSRFVTQLAEVPILIRNGVPFCEFELQVDFCYQNLSFVVASRGEALSDTTHGRHDWEFFTYRVLPYTDSLYRCYLYGICDIPNGPHQGVPLAPNSEHVSLVVLKFLINNAGSPDGTFSPIIFEWEVSDCTENTFQDPSFDTLYVSQDSVQFNTMDCPPESVEYLPVSSSLEFSDGGVHIFHPSPPIRGDINANWVPYEVGDFVLFSHYLQYGDSVLMVDPERQSANSDVNWDDWRWSIANFIHLGRVILHDAPEASGPTDQSQDYFSTWMTKVHSLPGDTVVLPIWYEGEGTEPVHGISLKIDYDSDSVFLVSVDFSETSLENWEVITTRLEDGSVRVNACPAFGTTSLSDSLFFYSGPRQIAKLVFELADVDTPTFISVSFGDDTSSLVQANAFATIDGPLTRLGISDVTDGGIQVGGSLECKRGDVNFNTIAYEGADVYLFHSFLLHGPGVLIHDPELQTCASDVNCDYLYWTIADFLYFIRVILHDAVEIPCKSHQTFVSDYPGDVLNLVSSSGHPGEVVPVPIWLSNSTSAWGTTFKLIFDQGALSVEGVDVAQTRLEGWEEVNPVINPGELFFFAFPSWNLGGPAGYPSIPPEEGILIKVNFRLDASVPAGIAVPITFETNEDWGHYNAYTDTTGLTFVQPSTVSGWIYTDVISGDANSDGIVDVADLVYLTNYLYRGKWPPSPESLGDFTQDGEVDVSDVVALINYLFRR